MNVNVAAGTEAAGVGGMEPTGRERVGRSVIQTQAVVHHSYDDLLDTPAALAIEPATDQRQSLSTCTR